MTTLYVVAFVVLIGLALLNASLAGIFGGRPQPSVRWARDVTLVGVALLVVLVLVDLLSG